MKTKTLVFEIGTEELPAFDLHDATIQLPTLAEKLLDDKGVPHGALHVYTTPRRLITLVEDVPEQTEELKEVFRGPSSKIAFDDQGNLTKAALGFARSKGVKPQALEQRSEKNGTYVYAVKSTPAQDVIGLLSFVLKGIIEGLKWPRSQRWGNHGEVFSRPVRWLCALLGSEVIPVSFAGVTSSNKTFGHRFLAPGPFEIESAEQLIGCLRDAFVLPSEQEREQSIRKQIAHIEEELGLVADLPARTVQEVVNLTEYPTVMVGHFDKLFLEVPKEIIVDAMLVHQRYFPLFDATGALTNAFLITSNGDARFEATIIDGNERVVAARLFDAKFFFDEDRKRPLAEYVDDLDDVIFQEKLGTMKSKTDRIVQIAQHLACDAGASDQERSQIARAAYLCKADLVTSAVVEFTSVQGTMGAYYALDSGEDAVVAQAIAEHYRPRFAKDAIPESLVGKIVACADKLDTICGLFAIGQAPTGSSDPFALRRGAIGIIAMLNDDLAISLTDAIEHSLSILAKSGVSFDHNEITRQIIEFFITRTRVLLHNAGHATDTIDAVLAGGVVEPFDIRARVRALEDARKRAPETFDNLATAYARANNLRDDTVGTEVDASLFEDAERALDEAISLVDGRVNLLLDEDNYPEALVELASLRAPIDRFFEEVMVMDQDEQLRTNRLRLLNKFVSVFANVADFGKMAKATT